jgi:hypothetical protein
MGILIIGAITRVARDKLRALALVAVAFCFSVGGTILPAAADNGSLYVAPGPSSLIAPEVIRRNQEQLAGTARKLGDLVGNLLKSSTSHATDLVVTTKCGHYLSASISYADGIVKTINLGNATATQSDMDKAKAAIPILRIVEESGCDH